MGMNVWNYKEEVSMDALKTIAQDSLKTEIPQMNIGDTVRVAVMAASLRPLPFAAYPMVAV